jgi:hypothetical protein
MRHAYESVIAAIETKEINRQTDELLQRLGEEIASPPTGRPAFRQAVNFLVDKPSTDPTPAARFHRLAHLSGISERELNEKVEMFIDIVFEHLRENRCALA